MNEQMKTTPNAANARAADEADRITPAVTNDASKAEHWVVIGHNTAVDEFCGVFYFPSETLARQWVEDDIQRSITEPFTQSGHPMWSAEDIDRTDPNRIRAADEFEWVITELTTAYPIDTRSANML